jgi:hypothetical protein
MSRSMAPTLTRFDDAYGSRCAEHPTSNRSRAREICAWVVKPARSTTTG